MTTKRTVAVMQPYFAPYAGYYRLLATSDVFVIFDCVQFPRRGWVHRNRLPNAAGEAAWLTLPLAPAAYDARIDAVAFAADAAARVAEQMRRFPSLTPAPAVAAQFLSAPAMTGRLVDYLEQQIAAARDLFGFDCEIVRSSALSIDPALRAQDRILAILAQLDATDYVNAPGGRALYDSETFAAKGVDLHFLPDYQGSNWSLLHELATRPVAELRADMLGQL